ncbi:MAG: TRAP transporter small permease [Sporomusaceae bacterium]|nr:TRAP transporter small permease [Sporomusaceae bacterium]
MPFINNLVTKFEQYSLVFLITVMTFLGLAQIVSRFVIQSPIPWTEALLTYMFVWTCFLGASLAVELNAHFGVEIFVVMLPKPVQRVMEIAVYLLIITFAVIMIVKGMMFVEGNADQEMAAMPFSMIWPYLAIPVSGLFIAIHALNAIYCLVRGRK